MSPISLRESWQNRYGALKIGAVIRAHHPFYMTPTAQKVVSSTARFPYKSMRTLIESLTWPNREDFVPTAQNHDYPARGRPGWNRLAQGVAHDQESWYLTQANAVWKFPLSHDLGSSDLRQAIGPKPIPQHLTALGYDHFGDPDLQRELLYVPLEGEEAHQIARIVVFSKQLEYIADAELDLHDPRLQQRQAPWCAINPLNGLLYSSAFQISATNPLVVCRPFLSGAQFTLNYAGHFELYDEAGGELTIERVQGGSFSSAGHLYLVSDTLEGGIMGFDMITGRRVVHVPVDYQPYLRIPKPEMPDSGGEWVLAGLTGGGSLVVENITEGPDWVDVRIQELEGITICDRDTGESPNIRGQIHLLMLHHLPDDLRSINDLLSLDFENNAVYFKHYEIRNPMVKTKL